MAESTRPDWRIVIHGGAGVLLRQNMSADKEAAYRAGLEASLAAGADVLSAGGSAVDAVQAAVIVMEDDELFNAGKGAVMTAAYEHELDASIMDGRDRNAGAVAGVKRVKNPILAARAVMDQSEHVMFAGEGADAFAESVGLDMVVVPGDIEAATLSAIIADEIAIGVVNKKTTAVRIIPVPGKGPGDRVEFGGLLGTGTIMPVKPTLSRGLIARGGQIPAPVQSLVN